MRPAPAVSRFGDDHLECLALVPCCGVLSALRRAGLIDRIGVEEVRVRPINRAIAACAVLAMCLAACGENDSISGAPMPAESVPTTESVDTIAPTEVTTPAVPETAPTVTAPADGTDLADAYLGATTELYRRSLPDGQEFAIRLSDASYASVFGMVWNAPTGSAEACLGDRTVFFGVPGVMRSWGSAWTATRWFIELRSTLPVVLQSTMAIDENSQSPGGYFVLRTATDAPEIILFASDGIQVDRAPVANGVAMVVMPPQAFRDGETVENLTVKLVDLDGRLSAPVPLTYVDQTTPPECGPGEPPQRSLPPAGEQPADPEAAEAQIRERHALLIDRSVSADEKPSDLLDDDTGVQTAIAVMDDGPYADQAASATYAIDELVFTTPEEAWFRYTITTSASTFANRFGQATFNGQVWQITRATLCQDLALAQAPCRPESPSLVVPLDPEFEAEWMDWQSRAMLYNDGDGCAPLSQC